MRRLKRFGALSVVTAFLAWTPLDAAADQRSPLLDKLFAQLQTTQDADEARKIEGWIWRVWTRRGEQKVDVAMARGISAMSTQAFSSALSYFNRAIELAPDYAEAWNKRATLHYFMGNYDASVLDIRKTLELEPRHFGALAGLGLIYNAYGNDEGALRALERVLEIHPLMDGVASEVERLRGVLGGKKI